MIANEPTPNATPYLRTLTDHITNPVNDKLTITVTDTPGAGGANHRYEIAGFDTSKNRSKESVEPTSYRSVILFQNGPIPENGVNGFTQEVLLAIVIDRLRSFQKGAYACVENAGALGHVEAALARLKDRTLARMERGVEGTHAK